jgi:diguanylate cyclase (GGDEF)-like protein
MTADEDLNVKKDRPRVRPMRLPVGPIRRTLFATSELMRGFSLASADGWRAFSNAVDPEVSNDEDLGHDVADAMYDANRRYFDELLAIMGPRRRDTDSLGIMMIDIDHFKRLNDRFGHARGDDVLREVASAIALTLRAEDTPVRYGGEEFAVILRRAAAAQASEAAERVRAAVAALPATRLGLDGPVTVSVGVAIAGEEEEVSAVIGRADEALYRAKRRGRDRVEVAG